MARGDQLARQWMIFQTLLSSKYGKTVNDLTADLDCHPRTVYRDLEALQAAGFPIYKTSKNGTNFWGLIESARQQIPIPLSLSELMALYFGRGVLKVLKDTVFYDSLESLFKKVKTTLPIESKKYLAQVEKSFNVGITSYKKYGTFKQVINVLNQTVIEKKSVEITYYTISRKKVTQREVEPYKLWFFDGGLYLIGRCLWKKEIRIFAVDRIKMIQLTGSSFKVPADFDVDVFMRYNFGVIRDEPEKVRIWFSSGVAEFVKERIWHESQSIQEHNDGSIIFELEVAVTVELKLWVMRWGSNAMVIKPESLNGEIRSELEAMAAIYNRGSIKRQFALTG